MNPDEQRKKMVETQLIPRGISDSRTLDAFRRVPRHHYVGEPYSASAYADHPLPIGHGQTISQPYIVALMTQALRPEGGEKVLEVGTGSGYQAAILAELCGEVYTVEKEKPLLDQAEKLLTEEGYKNVYYKCGDGTEGWEERSPFDGILVTAAAPDVPAPLLKQLADGGRLVIPVGTLYSQMLVVLEKRGDKYRQEDLCGCIFVPLVGKYGWKG